VKKGKVQKEVKSEEKVDSQMAGKKRVKVQE